MTRTLLTEAQAGGSQATPVEGKPGRFLLQLINPGWGSSGFYAPEVLEAAAAAKVFPAGLHMYLDHPNADGSRVDDHGNRSIADLAAVLAEDARWTGDALVAEATVFGTHRQTLADAHESIGPSIRAYAEAEYGEAEGRQGTIVQSLLEAKSVDFVSRPGRGGKILQVLESAVAIEESRNIGQWIESRIHRDFTITADDMAGDGRLTREERIGLSSAIGDALAAFVASLEANQPQLYTRDLWEDPQDTVGTALAESAAIALEGKYDADQMKALLAKGHAIKNANGDPSYPIDDVADLRKAIKAVGRGGKDHDKIRAYIIRRAKALGQSELIPDNWTASGAMESTLVGMTRRAIARGVLEATANDTREALQNLLRDAYGGEDVWVYVRDFDDSTVWFEINSGSDSGLYGQSYTSGDSGAVALSGARTEVRVSTTYVPATRLDGNTTEESEEDTMPNIEESELTRLRESAGRVQTLESERDAAVTRAETAETERDTAREQLAESTRTSTVQRIVTEAADAAHVELNEFEAAGLASRAVITDGVVDEAATRTAFDTAVATIKEARGPIVTGFGRTKQPMPDVLSESDLDALGDAVFGPIQTQEA